MSYALLSVRGEVGADNNIGERGSADGDRGGGRDIANHRDNLTRFMIPGKLTACGAEMTDERAASNMGRGRESGPAIRPRSLG